MSRLLVAALVVASVPAAWARGADFKTAWMAPEAKGTVITEKDTILVVVMNARPESRNGAEADLAQELKRRGATVVPAYAVIPPDVVGDVEKARPYIEKTGARYAITMRVIGKDKELRGSGPQLLYTTPYYGYFYGGYYTFGWGATYSAGVMDIQNVIKLETLFYDLESDKLIWAGISETRNPSTVHEFIKDVVKEASKEMKKQGFLKR